MARGPESGLVLLLKASLGKELAELFCFSYIYFLQLASVLLHLFGNNTSSLIIHCAVHVLSISSSLIKWCLW